MKNCKVVLLKQTTRKVGILFKTKKHNLPKSMASLKVSQEVRYSNTSQSESELSGHFSNKTNIFVNPESDINNVFYHLVEGAEILNPKNAKKEYTNILETPLHITERCTSAVQASSS